MRVCLHSALSLTHTETACIPLPDPGCRHGQREAALPRRRRRDSAQGVSSISSSGSLGTSGCRRRSNASFLDDQSSWGGLCSLLARLGACHRCCTCLFPAPPLPASRSSSAPHPPPSTIPPRTDGQVPEEPSSPAHGESDSGTDSVGRGAPPPPARGGSSTDPGAQTRDGPPLFSDTGFTHAGLS